MVHDAVNLDELKIDIMGGAQALRHGQSHRDNSITLVTIDRLDSVRELIESVVADNIHGDIIETGVWKGGVCIWMREILNSLNSDKVVYVADSFEGCPVPNIEKYPIDVVDYHYTIDYLRVAQEEVEANFKRFSTLDNVKFVNGWFKDTLHLIDAEFSIIRLDGDLYESTMDAMKALYPRLSIGGYCIIDDWGETYTTIPAVTDYMETLGATLEGGAGWLLPSGLHLEMQFTGPTCHWRKEE